MLGGGIPRGRFTSIAGDPNTGKTTIALLVAAYVTKNPDEMQNGGRVLFIDAEREHNPGYGYSLGIVPSRFDLYHIDEGEMILDLIMLCALEGKKKAQGQDYDPDYVYDLIIIDSVPSIGFTAELEQTADDSSQPALHARQWTRWHRKIAHPLYMSGTAVYAINRITTTFDQYAADFLFGGKAWTYKSNTIIDLLSAYKPDSSAGSKGVLTLRPKILRSKVTGERRRCEVNIRMDVPQPFVDIVPELTSIGKDLNVFTNDGKPIKGAPYWWFDGEQVADSVGEKPVQARLYSDRDFRKRVEKAVAGAIQKSIEPEYTDPETGEVFTSLADYTAAMEAKNDRDT